MKLTNKKIKNILLAGVFGMALAVSANASDPLKITLTASQVINENGKSVLKTVTKAKSGDTIRYQATYQNNLQKTMTDVAINIPIPAGLLYTGSTNPAPTHASLDGKKFESIPLKRQVNGKWVEVPVTEYRVVRWVVKSLPSKKQAAVTLDAKVK